MAKKFREGIFTMSYDVRVEESTIEITKNSMGGGLIYERRQSL